MEAVEQGRVAVEGGQVAYRVYGTGSRALLCLHGGPGCPSSYLDSIADLASDEEIIQNDAPIAQIDGDDRPVPALRPLGILVNPKDVRPDSQASSPRSPRGPPVSA